MEDIDNLLIKEQEAKEFLRSNYECEWNAQISDENLGNKKRVTFSVTVVLDETDPTTLDNLKNHRDFYAALAQKFDATSKIIEYTMRHQAANEQ